MPREDPGATLAQVEETLRRSARVKAAPGEEAVLDPVEAAVHPDAGQRQVVLSGRVTVEEVGGWLNTGVSGVLTIGAKEKGGQHWMQAQVTDGWWQLELYRQEDGTLALQNGSRRLAQEPSTITFETLGFQPTDGLGVVARMERAGSLGSDVASGRMPFGTDNVDLLFERLQVKRVHVLDAATGEALRGAKIQTVHPSSSVPFKVTEQAADEDTPADAAPPPLMLEFRRGSSKSKFACLVGCAGYASHALALDFHTPGDETVKLSRPGTLVLDLTGHAVPRGGIRIYTVEDWPGPGRTWNDAGRANGVIRALHWPANQRVVVDDLPAGQYVVEAAGMDRVVFVGESIVTPSATEPSFSAFDIYVGEETTVTLQLSEGDSGPGDSPTDRPSRGTLGR